MVNRADQAPPSTRGDGASCTGEPTVSQPLCCLLPSTPTVEVQLVSPPPPQSSTASTHSDGSVVIIAVVLLVGTPFVILIFFMYISFNC